MLAVCCLFVPMKICPFPHLTSLLFLHLSKSSSSLSLSPSLWVSLSPPDNPYCRPIRAIIIVSREIIVKVPCFTRTGWCSRRGYSVSVHAPGVWAMSRGVWAMCTRSAWGHHLARPYHGRSTGSVPGRVAPRPVTRWRAYILSALKHCFVMSTENCVVTDRASFILLLLPPCYLHVAILIQSSLSSNNQMEIKNSLSSVNSMASLTYIGLLLASPVLL